MGRAKGEVAHGQAYSHGTSSGGGDESTALSDGEDPRQGSRTASEDDTTATADFVLVDDVPALGTSLAFATQIKVTRFDATCDYSRANVWSRSERIQQ